LLSRGAAVCANAAVPLLASAAASIAASAMLALDSVVDLLCFMSLSFVMLSSGSGALALHAARARSSRQSSAFAAHTACLHSA